MISRKYTGDYRLENQTEADGTIKTVPVYRGAYYVFEFEKKRTYAIRLYGACALVFWVAVLTGLLLNTRCARSLWVVFPQVLSLLPAGYASVGIWDMIKAPDQMIREKAEHVRDRISGGALAALILASASVIGSGVTAALYWEELILPADAFYIIMQLAAVAALTIMFINRRYSRVLALAAPEQDLPEGESKPGGGSEPERESERENDMEENE